MKGWERVWEGDWDLFEVSSARKQIELHWSNIQIPYEHAQARRTDQQQLHSTLHVVRGVVPIFSPGVGMAWRSAIEPNNGAPTKSLLQRPPLDVPTSHTYTHIRISSSSWSTERMTRSAIYSQEGDLLDR